MVGVVFHWDVKDGLGGAAKRLNYQGFDYTCRAFGVDAVAVIDPDGSFPFDGQIKVFSTLGYAQDTLQFVNMEAVYISDEPGAEALAGYEHPRDAVYIIGGDYSGVDVPGGDDCVRICYPNQEMELWADVALGMVLFDRSAKGW